MPLRHTLLLLAGIAAGCSGSSVEGIPATGYLAYDVEHCGSCEAGVLTSCQLGRAVTSVAIIDRPRDGFRDDLRAELQCPHDASTPRRIAFDLVEHVFGPEITDESRLVGYAVDGQALVATAEVDGYHQVMLSIGVELVDQKPADNPFVGIPNDRPALREQLSDLQQRFDELCPATDAPSAEELREDIFDTCRPGEPIEYTNTVCDELVDHLVFECGVAPPEAVAHAEPCVALVPPHADVNNGPMPSSPLDGQSALNFVDCLTKQSCDATLDVDACDPRTLGTCEEWVRILRGCGTSRLQATESAEEHCMPRTEVEREQLLQCLDDLPCDTLNSGYWEEACAPD